MESFFYQGPTEECTSSWTNENWASLSYKRSDFVPYEEKKWMNVDYMRNKNVNVRMVEMLREQWKKNVEAEVPRREKSFRHMVKERMRRQSHREGYTGLHAILPLGTKCDKLSITTAATTEIIKTQRMLEELQKRNVELNEKLESSRHVNVNKVRIRIEDSKSGIDSMLEILHCLQDLGSDIKKMLCHFSDQEVSADIEINADIAKNEVEIEVDKIL